MKINTIDNRAFRRMTGEIEMLKDRLRGAIVVVFYVYYVHGCDHIVIIINNNNKSIYIALIRCSAKRFTKQKKKRSG